ncbi:GGDEF domain-containing protein [Jatrophihabitans sp. DSM 45814]
MRAYLFTVEAVAAVFALTSVVVMVMTMSVSLAAAARFVIFIGLFAFFQRVSSRTERLRIRVFDSHQIDMTSVWTFAGVVALPMGLSATLAIVITTSMFGLRLRNGRPPHRQVFNAATVVLACIAGSAVLHDARPHFALLSPGATEAVCVAIAIVIYTLVQTTLVGGAIYLAAHPIPVRSLFGTWEENALELATLCLGGMTAIVALYVPWLTALAVVPMVVLQRGALFKQLEAAATTDQKTGLLNAVTWRQIVGKELARAERDRQGAAMLIIDMDKFKSVNDTYGHMVGDAVLKAAADALTTELREYDTIGRFGGEEFVALLPDVNPDVLSVITERVLARIRALEIQSPDNPDRMLTGFSASIGVALYPHHGTEVELLLHAADAALYEAKRGGRDRVQFVGTTA